jgi:peptidase M28-like protein
MQTIERLCSFGPRWPGLEGDRRATEYLANELELIGREVAVEPIRVRPAYHLTLALLAAVAVGGNLLSVSSPPLGVAVLLLAAAAIYGDMTTRALALRWITSRRPTANVTSPGGNRDARARIVLTAHHDAPAAGLLFAHPRILRRRRPFPLSRLAGRLDLLFWTTIAALAAAVVRLLTGTDATLMTIVQFALTVVLMAFVALLLDSALAGISPGASSNASGAAAVLEVARRLERRPLENIEVWVVFTGAKEGFMLGMRAWLNAHAEDLDRDRTYFLNVDSVGNGDPHHVTGEGFALLYRHDLRLVRLCESVGSRPHVWRLGTDGVIPAMRGYSSITLCSLDRNGRIPNFHAKTDTPDRVEPDAVERATDFVEEVVRRIDAAMAPAPATPTPAEARP